MALFAIQIKSLDGHGLRFQAGPKLVINEAFIDLSETSFTKKVVLGEALRDLL